MAKTALGPLLVVLAQACVALPAVAQESVPRPKTEDAEAPQRAVLGRPTGFAASTGASYTLSVGDRILAGPTLSAEQLVEIPAAPVDERRAVLVEQRSTESGDWVRIRWGGRVGWVLVRPIKLSEEGADAVLAEPTRLQRRSDLAERARSAVPGGTEHRWQIEIPTSSARAIKPLRVWSDLEAKPLRQLQRLTECIGGLYTERYGPLSSVPALDLEMIVFADGDRYQTFAADAASLIGEETGGFEVDGLIVLLADTQMEVNFLGTAAHELTHALNRLAFSEATLLPWVEEGMAEDLAHSVEAAYVAAKKLCRRPGGWSRTKVSEHVVMVDGVPRKETRLERSARSRSMLCYPGPEGVLDLMQADRSQFMSALDRRWKYVESLVLVRALLAQLGEDPRGDSIRRLLLQPKLQEPELAIIRSLARLEWRAEERLLFDC